jgi:dTDP-4-amino-4,6-dideoxygalactose transaminase
MIEKIAKEKSNYLRNFSFDNRARDCWKTIILNHLEIEKETTILLPAYIGWSSNEGSGIFDPIKELSCSYMFYKISNMLQIDIDDFKKTTLLAKKPLVLLVHYFGFPDKKYQLIADWLTEKQIPFIEDCAHALYSDLCGNSCGKLGAATFYSLHKMLPFNGGGMYTKKVMDDPLMTKETSKPIYPFWNYDLFNIYNKRRENANYLLTQLSTINNITIIHPKIENGVGPQTLPIRLENNRNNVYQQMNAKGFGMVSLYHTMIDEISELDFPESHQLASQIINFPIHQDVSILEIDKMVKEFKEVYNNA